VAVCLLPGTELSLAEEVTFWPSWYGWNKRVVRYRTAIFRQINLNKSWAHHDALEFPDGEVVLLTLLNEANTPRYFSFLRRRLGPRLRNKRSK
jgi:hypothetical protein